MAHSDVGVGSGMFLTAVTPPDGLERILATFGDIHEYLRKDGTLDPRWQADFLARASLPFALRLSWDLATSVSQMTCHKRLVEVFTDVLERIAAGGMQLEDPNLRRMLFVPAAKKRQQAIDARLGDRHRSESRNECAGIGGRYGSGSDRNFSCRGIRMARRLERHSERWDAFSVLHGILTRVTGTAVTQSFLR